MKFALTLVAGVMVALSVTDAQSGTSVLFIGNSFTYADSSPVRFYRAGTVTDMNGEGIGGVPALFKSFTQQAGIDYNVFLETRPGAGLDYHLENKLGVIGRRGWDKVVMHGFSTLDFDKPRDPAKLIATSKQMADFLRTRNPKVELYLMATWSRADQTYPQTGAWAGQPIEAMARDVRAAYDRAAASAAVKMVIAVGEAWTRAMQTGVADANPYDGIEPGKLNLWAHDHYHASAYGYYLEALVIFGSLTGRDPRSLGENECSAYELGFDRMQVTALQQVAFDQLASAGVVAPDPLVLPKPVNPVRCVQGP
ncbi:MAG: PEP-CTERM sorting domain-containing protein [Burkholderiales bacterium]|nr:PEP-CTERM sorting domain-containing protein [Burkholderiales bacterium]